MSKANYIIRNPGFVDRYEVYEQDLSEWGITHSVKFNVDWVPKENRDWLLNVLAKNFERVAKSAHATGKKEVQKAIKAALGYE